MWSDGKIFEVKLRGVPDPDGVMLRLLDLLGPGRGPGYVTVIFAEALPDSVRLWMEYQEPHGNPSDIRRQLSKVVDGILVASEVEIRLIARRRSR
jgi:hypothetical protein